MSRTLHNRLSKLEASSVLDKDFRHVLIVPKDGERPEEAPARHYAEHPEDVGAPNVIQIRFVAPGDPS